ncbi:MAG: hypothetical protein RBS07_01505 [Lentimicrobium sp.]|jgi:predicted anti-sigma-YlaC factor YlaD|nr:hypothetical protein [Lentimicrobium sp.]
MKNIAQENENNCVKSLKQKPMNCEQCELMIFDLPFSAKDANFNLLLQEHLAQCKSCRDIFDRHLAEMQQLKENRRVQPDSLFYDRLLLRMESNLSPQKGKISKVGKILQLSPAILSAAAAIILGIWIGGRLTINIQPAAATTVASRQLMLDAVAEDLNLKDVSESLLESYLTDNENSVQP